MLGAGLITLAVCGLSAERDVIATDVRAKMSTADGSTAFQVIDSANQVVGRVDSDGNLLVIGSATVVNGFSVSTGNVALGTLSPNAKLHVRTAVDNQVGLIVQALSASQSADLLEIQDNAGNIVTAVTNAGWFANIGATGGSTSFASRVTGDGYYRFALFAGGLQEWGDGTTDRDVSLSRLAAGNLTAKTYTNSVTGFGVQNSAGTSIFNVDTSNGRVGVGTNAPSMRLHVTNAAGTTGHQFLVSTGTTKLLEVTGASVTVVVPVSAPNIITSYAAVSPNPDDASTIDWTNNTSMVSVPHGDLLIDGAWHSVNGACQIKLIFRADNDANDSVVELYDTTGASSVISYTVTGGQSGYGNFESAWTNYTWSGMRLFNVRYRTTNAASYTGVQKAWVLVRSQQ